MSPYHYDPYLKMRCLLLKIDILALPDPQSGMRAEVFSPFFNKSAYFLDSGLTM